MEKDIAMLKANVALAHGRASAARDLAIVICEHLPEAARASIQKQFLAMLPKPQDGKRLNPGFDQAYRELADLLAAKL